MAGLLEARFIPRVSALPSASLPPVSGSVSFRFSEFRGLKSELATPLSAKLNSTRKLARTGSRIVCEAQGTAVGEEAAVTESTWQSLVLASGSPVFVEFWGPWCGPCRMIHPVIDKLAKDHAGKLKCFKPSRLTLISALQSQHSMGSKVFPPSLSSRTGRRKKQSLVRFKNLY